MSDLSSVSASVSGSIVVVILAAGGSSRMGKPKQLLSIGGMPLLQKAVNAAVTATTTVPVTAMAGAELAGMRVIVVLGANVDEIRSAIDFDQCQVLVNENWQSGMSSAISLALNYMQGSAPEAAGVLLMMGDQPYVTDSVLGEIVGKYRQTGLPIVVSSFCARGSDEKIPGPPAFFAREIFPELLQLEGDAGARKVVLADASRVASIEFPMGAIDIDTEGDYALLLQALG